MIRQAVIPAAGVGTRFLPVTKQVPKELLPIVDKPSLQYVIEEGVNSGIEEFIIVISKSKELLRHYFEPNLLLEEWITNHKEPELFDHLKNLNCGAKLQFVYQDSPKGLGDAVLCAKPYINSDYFMVILPDDIVDAEIPLCAQMKAIFEKNKQPLVSVMEVDWEEVHNYGVVEANPLSESEGEVSRLIEKPTREEAPSNLGVVGRYLLPSDIFDLIEKVGPDHSEEVQLTDALQSLANEGRLMSYLLEGERFDVGTPWGFLRANFTLAAKNEKYASMMNLLAKEFTGF